MPPPTNSSSAGPARPRVLFAIHAMDGGGAERQMIEILRHLDRGKFEPFLYLQTANGVLLDEVPADIPIHSFWERCPNYQRWQGPTSWAQSRDMTRLIRELSIDLVYHRCYLMNLMASPACRRAGVPQIASTVAEPEAELRMHSKVGTLLSWWNARQCYWNADCVLANSEGLRQRNIAYYRLPPERVKTIYNLFDLQRIDQMAAEPGPSWDRDHYHIVIVGRLDHRKGQHLAIHAISILQQQGHGHNIQLHLLGKGSDEEKLRQMAIDLQVEQRVHFHGFQVNPLPWVRSADLYCLSSLNEGMPNALVEAAACRTPTVATDCPSGPREILLGDLVPVNDPAALAAAILNRYQNPPPQSELELQRQHVADMFSWPIGMTQLENLMLKLTRPDSA